MTLIANLLINVVQGQIKPFAKDGVVSIGELRWHEPDLKGNLEFEIRI